MPQRGVRSTPSAAVSRQGGEHGGVNWEGIPSDRVVAVLASLDTGQVQIGSGYLVTERRVLTARHCTVDKRTSRSAKKLTVVRRSGGPEAPATVLAAGSELDVAVLSVEGPPGQCRSLQSHLDSGGWIAAAPEMHDCQAIGFPLWQLDPADQGRNAAELHGTIRAIEGIEAGLLVMRDPLLSSVAVPGTVAADDQADKSPWGGVSGALVFYQGLALGVVIEHYPWQGGSAITIVPVERFVVPATDGDAGIVAVAAALELNPYLLVTTPFVG